MKNEELKKKWLAEQQESFRGWDFSHLKGRWEEEVLPWDYRELINQYRKPEYKLLDMGTGGGEFLLSLKHPHENTTVTEGWEPNVALCRKHLEPLGITVHQVWDDGELPFDDQVFDMIINRHEAYDIKEVKRVLKPKGIFITQQVGGRNNEWLSNLLIPDFQPEFPDFTLEKEMQKFYEAKFHSIYSSEYDPYLRFYDIGALVYFAKIIQWEFPGFSVDRCYEKLCMLQEQLLQNGFVESKEHRFVIIAQKI